MTKAPLASASAAAATTASASSETRLSTFLPSRTFETQREYGYFDFFRFQTVTDLSGWFSSYFWHRLVLQMSHGETVVRRAAVALGALQMEDGSNRLAYAMGDHQSPRLALQYYGEAVSGLRDLLSDTGLRSIDVALTACILLACFEVFRKDYEAAQMHYTSGLKILKLWKGRKSYETVDYPYASRSQAVIPCYERALIEHFSLLETQVVSYLQSRPGFAQDAVLYEESVSKIPIPMEFTTLNEAKETFILVMNTTLNLANRTKDRLVFTETESERDENGVFRHRETYEASMQFAMILRTVTGECELALTQWMEAFDALYRRTSSSMSSQDIQSTSVLHLIYTCLYSLFSRDFADGEMGYDQYVQAFDDAVSHALVAIRQHHRHQQKQKQQQEHNRQPMFSLGLGVVTPLHFIATKCRHRAVRESAIHAISMAPLQEGIWGPASAPKTTRVLVDMEEQHRVPGTVGPEGIPREARIIGVNFLLKPEKEEQLFIVDRPGSREEKWVNYGSPL